MNACSGFVICVLAFACTRSPVPAIAPDTCPIIASPGAPYPTVSYHTLVLDGKVRYARHGQRNYNPHFSIPIDSVAAGFRWDTRRIKVIRFLTGDSARLYEACPGVRVLAVDSERRRWWWPR